MRKKIWFFFVFLVMLIPITVGLYSNQPRFRSDNGHLYIESATNHNISLNTKGQGYINVNNENLLQIIGLAKEAWDVVESFRTNDLPAFADTMKNVVPMIDGPRSLTNRVTALELQMSNGTSSSLQPANKKGGDIPNARRLLIRLNNLEKKVNNLVNLLSISECLSNPCQNGGTCMDMYNGFQCNCPQNWQGRTCEVDVDECVRFVHTDLGCQNGAECKNTPGSYECICAPNWYGLHCTKKKNDCNAASSAELCGNGVCVNQASVLGFTCICNQGWTTDGGSSPACIKDIDECKENRHTCSVNPPVECRNTRGSFTCGNCPRGYEGDGFVCTDVNECLINNGGCSVNPRVQCLNTLGSFKCESCPPGYSGDGFNCVYVTGGACAINNGGCHPNAECTVYAETSIQCTCRQGYKGNGIGINGCILDNSNVNPCTNISCGRHGICLPNMNHTFTCLCDEGYSGKTCNIHIGDPCLENPCHNGECVRGSGLHYNIVTCICPQGYFGPFCESLTETCGGYFETNNGSIRYPESNATLTYQSNLNCAWTIDVNQSYVLNMSFVWLDVEKTIDCVFDYVAILNSDDDEGKLLGKFCGNTLPVNNSIISDSNMVVIRFHSDQSKNYGGFQLNYKIIEPNCGGSLHIDSHGTLSSPGSPGKYPPNRDCYWTLNAVPGKRIQLHFFLLKFERHLNCSFDYLEIRDGFTKHSPILAKLCNSTIPPPILTSGSNANLHFHSDASGQDYGFQLSYSVIEGIPGCGGIYTGPSGVISSPVDLTSDNSNYMDNLNCEWHIRMPLHQKLKLTFVKKFGIEFSSNCSSDFLEIHDGPSIKSPLIGRYCGKKRFEQPIITNSNEVTLLFISDFSSNSEGFSIKYETVCGGTFTDSKGIIESPFYPNPYPQNKICIYLIAQPVGKAIRLSFIDMDIEDLSYPKCIYDYLEIRDGDNENSTRIALLCGSIEKLPKLPYLSTHNYMWLKFSTDHSNINKGFQANYSTIDIKCGGILKDPSGIIQSSKHPEQYLHNQMCKWIISVDESQQIQLTWLTFSLENQLNCNNDFVEIYDNSISGNASKIARYCGTKVPPILTSLGNRLTIVFKTDHSVAQDGFMLSYISLNKAQACGGNFFTSEGFIKSPNYPDDYPKLKECTWIINVPVTNQIELNITEFLLEESLDCRFDYLEIRNGGYSTSPLIGKYCGSKIRPTVSSMGNSLFIKFVSDASRNRKGFLMQWYITTKGCGGILNSGIGHIVSPNYPLPIQETLECFYKIAVMQGSQIKLTISDIELTTNNFLGACKEDYLEFYDGGTTASKSLGTFCSDVHSSTLVHSSSNQMYIKFRNSGFSRGRGFSLTYTTDCNVTIKGYQGAIEIDNQENLKTDKCAWTIVAPKGSSINITFTSLQIQKYKNRFRMFLSNYMNYTKNQLPANQCNNSQLTISEGVNIKEINTVLWKYCTSDPPTIISSSKNIVKINYYLRQTAFLFEKFEGFRMEWIINGCGGLLDQSEGEFMSPGYPGYYPSSITCEWNIVVDHGKTIEISIQDLWLDTSLTCSYDFLAIYSGHDDSGPELLRLCHKQTSPITITSGGNEAFVRFESDEEGRRKGFNAIYRTIPSKCGGKFIAPQGTIHTSNYPQNYDSNSSCMWFIEIADTHLINLTFVDFSTRNFPATNKDKVLVYDGDINGKLLLNHSGNIIPPSIISSSNKLLISFEVGKRELRAKGFKAIYTTACGAKLITNDSGIITSDSYLTKMVHENCTWTIIADTLQSKITLLFTHIDLIHHNENVHDNKENHTNSLACYNADTMIRVLDGPDSDAPEIMKLCTSVKIPLSIVSNGPAMRIEFIDDSFGLNSFTALYSIRSIACGGIYGVIKGTISSPNYPNNYLRDSECVWTLKASVGNRISLKFIDFVLEENEFCNEDYVEVRENDSVGPILGIFCGSNVPTNITLSSSFWIKFRSNSIGSAKGFTADFNYVTENYLTQPSGEISNPMYPKSYRNSDDYSWTITVQQGKRIQIIIKEIICTSMIHHLKIYDGSNVEASSLLELDYNNFDTFLNETIVSNDNILYIKLKGGSSDMWGIHFLLSWIQIDEMYTNILYPEYEVYRNKSSFDYYLSPSTNTSIILTSPGYPFGYAPNLNVTWTIHTEPLYHIEVNFLDVDLNFINLPSESYYTDYILVETVDPDTANTIYLNMISKNTDKKSDLKVIGKNKVILTFISNKSLNGSGFKAEAKLKCGGQLRGPNGIIMIDGSTIATSYITDICTWNVTVRRGNTILVKFLSMQLYTSGHTCLDSYVIFKNGFYEDSPILGEGKYCNITSSATLITSENKLQIQAKLTPQEMIKISYEEKSTNCGGQIHLNDINNFNQITSPSYPNIPPAHIECVWTVVAPSGERLSVNLVDLDLSTDESCEKEYLEFRDGAAVFSPLINHLCKYFEMPDIETKENFLYIKYFTDANVPGNGFKLNVTIAKCGGTRRASKGTITSPNYPGSYESNMDCEYRIIVDPNYRIVLNFVSVNLKRRFGNPGVGSGEDKMNNETYDDTLTVYDIDILNSTKIMISQIFGSDLPSKPIKSSGRELVVKFKSHVKSGPFFMKNLQAKFVLTYWSEYDDCDKSFELESGEITSPGGLDSQRTYCIYRIKVPKGRRIIAELVEGRSVVQSCDNYRLIENMYKEKLVGFMGGNYYRAMCIEPVTDPKSLNYIYESTSNEMILVYEFVRGIQSGFRIKFSSGKPSVCGGVIDASNNGKIEMPFGNITTFICQWDFKNTNGTVVIIANFIVNESKFPCSDNNHLLFASDELESMVLKTYCSSSNKNDKFTIISPFSLTKLLVKANSKTVNFRATLDYSINSCGGIINGRKITVTSPNYPNNYQQTTNCAWLAKLSEGDNVNIHFNDIDLDSSCDNNYIILHDGPSPESPVLGKYCGNVLPEDIVATSNNIWIVFSTENINSNKKGFNLTLESAQISCGKIYVSETGEFFSKNYPNLYPNNEECEWIIAVWPGNRVKLQFIERFSLEQSVNCTKDYVQIYDYINDDWVPLGNRMCGRQIPPAITSTEKKLKIRIRTDNSIQGDGFKATWKSFCGGIFTQSSGIIISPNYPRNYPNSIKCNYTILAPKKKIQLIFKSFNLEDSGCRYDNLTIYNKADMLVDETKHFTGSYCGDKVPHKLMFMDSVMMIFSTDHSSTEKGFEIHYTTEGCGGLITAPGLIKSPVNYEDTYNYFSGYSNNANCTWVIRAPENQVVQLVFTKFHLEPQYNKLPNAKEEERCLYDVVYVYDESDINSNTSKYLSVFCGYYNNDRLPEVISKTNTMYVQFISDSSRNFDGFIGEISFTYGESKGCGGTIRLNKSNNLSTYTLKSPTFPVKTELDCGWLILLEPSYAGQFQIVSYTETPKCPKNNTACRCSSIQVLDGPGRMAYKIREYCSGSVDYPSVMSSGSEAFIRYRTYNSDVDVNFEIKITPAISDCGEQNLIVTNETKILTSPKYPLPYGNNLACTWILEPDPSSRIISLRFTDIDLEDTKDCLSDYLEIQYTRWTTIPFTTFRLCHEDHEFDFIEQIDSPVTLKLRTDEQKTSKGFRLEYSNTKCKTKYEKRDGRIYVFDFGPGISMNDECTFTINLNQPNLTISVYFTSFYISGINSKNNYLKIYDGPTVLSPLVSSLTNIPRLPSPIFSTGPSLTMSYKSDDRWQGALDISYTSTDQGRGCGGRLFNVEGTVTSPMYPLMYRKDTSCRWDIAVPRPYPISIAFRIFNMGKRILCDTNYLELYNMDQVTGKSSFVAKYCGGDTPAYHTSDSGAVFVRYVTTVHSDSSGWVLHFKLVHELYNN